MTHGVVKNSSGSPLIRRQWWAVRPGFVTATSTGLVIAQYLAMVLSVGPETVLLPRGGFIYPGDPLVAALFYWAAFQPLGHFFFAIGIFYQGVALLIVANGCAKAWATGYRRTRHSIYLAIVAVGVAACTVGL